MPTFSADYLARLAGATGFRSDTLEKVLRLGRILDQVGRHPFLGERLALKGGTALNLFFGAQAPRLSVDLDFNYVRPVEREEMFREQEEIYERALPSEPWPPKMRRRDPRLVRSGWLDDRVGLSGVRREWGHTGVGGDYQRRCAITGEKALPVLQAAHIRPVTKQGPHRVDNGLLLRSDLHALFDQGYVTVTPDHRVLVSRRLKTDFDNGEPYYPLAGSRIWLPGRDEDQPGRAFLEWHADTVFRG